MSTELQKSTSIIATGKFEFTPTGVEAIEEFTTEEWKETYTKLGRIDGAIQWWIGDMALLGEKVNVNTDSKVYDELEEVTGLARETVRKCRQVSQGVNSGIRIPELSWSHHSFVAHLEPEEQKRWLKYADENRDEKGNPVSVAKLRRAIKAERYQDPELPEGKYRVIYMDPPWEYGAEQHSDKTGRGKSASGAQETVLETHYPTMSAEQLKAMDIPNIALDDCVLWMWATVPLLPQAIELGEHWGFNYKTHMVWDKVKHNVGNYISVRHELLLIFGKGSSTPDVGELVDSVYEEERTEHSKKPEYFRSIIDKLYPAGRRGEAFPRSQLPAHWDSLTKDVSR